MTGSQDCTVKLWPLPGALLAKGTAPGDGPTLLQAQTTQRCHDKVGDCTRPPGWGVWGVSQPLLQWAEFVSSPGYQQCGCRSQ